MESRSLITAGWITMTSAFASLPIAYLTWELTGRVDATATTINSVIQIVATVIFVVITLMLKRLLNRHFGFHLTDNNLDWMIKANVVAGILTLVALNVTSLKDTLGIAALLILIAQGIVEVNFGYRLLKLPDNLNGLLKPFCFANMATGLCIASVVLIPVGVLISAINDLMLGTIFFQVAGKLRDSDEDPGQ